MNRTPLILAAGGTLSFLVIFVGMSAAMGLLRHGPGPLLDALTGRAASHAPAHPPAGEAAPVAGHAPDAEQAQAQASAGGEHADVEHHAPDGAGHAPGTDAEHSAAAPEDAAPAPEAFISRARAMADLEESLTRRQQELEAERLRQQARVSSLESELATTRTQLDSVRASAIKDLAGVYQTMRPAAAAGIISQLDPDLQVAIIAQMEDRNAGKVLVEMDPRLAARISTRISEGKAAK